MYSLLYNFRDLNASVEKHRSENLIYLIQNVIGLERDIKREIKRNTVGEEGKEKEREREREREREIERKRKRGG